MYDDEVADDDDDNQSDNDDNSDQFTISLTVTVLKGDGPRLEFSCTATPDQISIDTMIIKDPDTAAAAASLEHQILYEGPEFSDLDENLQKAFYTYLEDRGIKSSLTNFLQEYMNDKENREYLTWLKSMKEFVEK
ncbi:hypothetical protein Syun_005691 [Stephania yunnanensis]|uniref:Mitochondrial acidic protein MAM33 n=1 Tax=Stephania yunnanensis TaxID=152371 RepID=A0AAP0L9E0_9MAGN